MDGTTEDWMPLNDQEFPHGSVTWHYRSAACTSRLGQFFRQWFDTAYPKGGGANRPHLTGPGLAGPGFYTSFSTTGGCTRP